MKVTVVPAQVTTVEDRIIGSLSMTQLMLLLVPVFIGFGVFGFLPPLMEGSIYKYVLLSVMAVVCSLLSIRVKGRILLLWLAILGRYYWRPGVYVYSKNNNYLRAGGDEGFSKARVGVEDTGVGAGGLPKFKKLSELRAPSPALAEVGVRDEIEVFEKMNQPDSPIRFEVDSKGGLYVRIRKTEA